MEAEREIIFWSTPIMWQAFYHTLPPLIPSANHREGFIDPILSHKETKTEKDSITSRSFC